MKKYGMFFLTILLVLSLTSGCTPVVTLSSSTPLPILPTITPTSTPTETPIPRILLPIRGLYVQFESRGHPSFYWSGDAINNFNTFDDVVGHTVAEEISIQLDQMKEMGVNTITFELRAADPTYIPGPFVPPTCNIGPALGLQYPQPTPREIENLKAFLNLLQGKELKVFLRLVNTHMEEQPPTKNSLWLGTILKAIKDYPALDLVLFEGYPFLIDTNGDGIKDSCGIPIEPELWIGPTSVGAKYVTWAIDYGHSLGLPYRKLSAEAIVGNYYSFNQGPAGPGSTDGHQWDPVFVLKGIFDSLNVPDNQRTYAISFHEHRKCDNPLQLPCVDANPHAWAIETVTNLFNTIGRQNGARVVAVEMGLLPPVENSWTTEMAFESLIWIMQNYGIEGGSFWRWTSFYNSEELDPTLQTPIKQRGVEFNYNPVKDVLQQLYTQGQTDDLILTPDAIPPVFSSVSTAPMVVKNGETLEISAKLGETHLFVWVEVSALDPNKTDLIVLMDQGDGTYKRQVTLSSWNEVGNGIKSLQITAMDFWSNITSTAVEIELNNPASLLDPTPPDENFESNILDTKKWIPDLAGGATITQDGRLMISTDSREADSAGSVSSVWNFPGDFDVQMDFQIGDGWKSPTEGHLDGAFFQVNIAGQSYRITRLMSGNEDKIFFLNWTDNISQEMATTAVAGKYRLIRTGATLIVLFDVGAGWQKLASKTVPLDSAQIVMGNGSISASQIFTTYFDNFHINSGLTTYKP